MEKAFQIRCSNCGNETSVVISATAWFHVTPDGSAELAGSVEWDDDCMAYCPTCKRDGKVQDFIKREG